MEKSNITEELIRFFIETIKNLERENAELREKLRSESMCNCYYDRYWSGTKEFEPGFCHDSKKNCDLL